MPVPPSRPPRKKKTPVVHHTPKKTPPEIDAKVKKACSCHRAGSDLAGVLAARSAIAHMLPGRGALAQSDDLGTALPRLVNAGRLPPGTARARFLTVLPSHPPVTPAETSALLNVVVSILGELYPGGPDV